VVFSIVQSKSTDIAYARKRLISLIERLREFRRDEKYFNSIYGNLIDEAKRALKRRKVTYDDEQHYRQLFIEILNLHRTN
jgi:hypothetical protein